MPVAHLVVVVVERLDGVEVAVDDDVEQAVEQEADAVHGEVGGAVPALEHGVDREAVVLADGDQPARADERVDLGLVERAALDVDPDRVAGQEQVGGVAVELGPLVGAERRPRPPARAGSSSSASSWSCSSTVRRSRPRRPCRAARGSSETSATGKPSASRTPLRYTLVMGSPITSLSRKVNATRRRSGGARGDRRHPGRQRGPLRHRRRSTGAYRGACGASSWPWVLGRWCSACSPPARSPPWTPWCSPSPSRPERSSRST